MPNKITLLCVAISLMLVVGCASQTVSSQQELEPTAVSNPTGVIVLGDVSDDPSSKIRKFQPLADYLATHLTEFGIGVGEVKIAPDMETMIAWIKAGEVDLYFDSPYPAMLVSEQANAQPILRRWKDGVASYHSIFFSRADRGLASIADLQGELVAFDQPYSTSGFMLPVAHLFEAGLHPVEKASVKAIVAGDEIGYVFSGEDENSIQWVISGRVAAAVTDGYSYSEIPESVRQQLTVLAETEDVPRQMVVVRDGLDADLVAVIESLLIELNESEEGRDVLDSFKTSQFDRFPEETEAALARMRELVEIVNRGTGASQ